MKYFLSDNEYGSQQHMCLVFIGWCLIKINQYWIKILNYIELISAIADNAHHAFSFSLSSSYSEGSSKHSLKTKIAFKQIQANPFSELFSHIYKNPSPIGPGGRLNTKMSSYQYRDPHVKDKPVWWPFYL